MKFWQLLSVAGAETIARSASQAPDWAKFGIWIANIATICNAQDRDKLDAELDTNFVMSVLSEVTRFCYLSENGVLRSWRFSLKDEELLFTKVFELYGGGILEEVCEKGSVKL